MAGSTSEVVRSPSGERIERTLDEIERRADVAERIEKLEERVRTGQWWQSAKTVTLLASLLAAVVPATAAVSAWFKQESDLALARQQQDHAMRMDYVKTVLSSEAAERDREARLRLLVAILEPDDRLVVWAKNELASVQGRIADLEKAVAAATAEALAAREKEREAQAQLTALQARAGGEGIGLGSLGTLGQGGRGAAEPVGPARTPAPPPEMQQQIQQAEVRLQIERDKRKLAAGVARTKQAALNAGDDPLAGLDGL